MSELINKNLTSPVRIDTKLRNYVKEEAARQQRSIRSLVEEALVDVFDLTKQERKNEA